MQLVPQQEAIGDAFSVVSSRTQMNQKKFLAKAELGGTRVWSHVVVFRRRQFDAISLTT